MRRYVLIGISSTPSYPFYMYGVVSEIRQQQPKDDVVRKELHADSFPNVAQGLWKAETGSLVQPSGPLQR